MSFICPTLIKEAEFTDKIGEISAEIEGYKQVETILSADRTRLYCERYISAQNRGNIVLVHGYTEFAEKYREMIYYFLKFGLNVFIYDQRGHGKSGRVVDDLNLVHLENFNDYVDDLEAVIEKQVKVYGGNLPLYLFSHSMGGAVASLYMMRHPKLIKKAVLSSPMIAPTANHIPAFLIKTAVKYTARKDGWSARFFKTKEFDPFVKFECSNDLSRSRFEWALDLRKAEPLYQASCATNRWMWECISVKEKLFDKKKTKNITTDILILSAENDRVVKNNMQRKFAKQLSSCSFNTIEHASHNIFFSEDEMLNIYYKLIFDFLNRRR